MADPVTDPLAAVSFVSSSTMLTTLNPLAGTGPDQV